ncbi:sugar-transfer associated ATP-grasp domain-containing protein [Candidatus Soleaferrea massiliensis]|uniref:sugar-transfer associated ATP-grasp domain-containing protein n=1 Tax=Candidatus Soleaferrea massiliensis TaxID=1470354 RepID=UPI00058DFFC7|nr:sugar-transfer associated ATP-grasp domain-containing protein [Candidatus Soleaferrea massiliensis]
MYKIKTLFRRIKGMSFERMFRIIGQIHEESKLPKVFIFLDMVWCALYYGVGYLDYQVFGFAYVRGKKRHTFMTMNANTLLIRTINNKAFDDLFTDKIKFNKQFHDYIGREFLDLREAKFEQFAAFVERNPIFFAKAVDEFGGQGIDRINRQQYPDLRVLYDLLRQNHQYDVEECIVQHEKMNLLSPSSVNTMRVVTVVKDGVPNLMYTLLRMGDGTKEVDNICSGGMYCPVDSTGRICKPAFCDKTGQLYETHTYTGTQLVGFEVPFYAEAIDMVKEAALLVPEIGYVGWDVAITAKGPVLVEGNTIPSYDMCQNYYHLDDRKVGYAPKFEEVLGTSHR